MKKVTIVIALIVNLCLFAGCTSRNIVSDKYEEKEQWEKEIDIEQQKELNVINEVGQITIQQWDQKQIKIVAEKKVMGYEKAKVIELLKSHNYDIKKTDSSITIESKKMAKPEQYDLAIHYTIFLPLQMKELEIVDDVGEMIIEGDYEKVDCKTQVGSISAELKQPKEISLLSEVGAVKAKLESADAEGEYKLETEVGEATLELPKDTRINVQGEGYTLENIIQSEDGIDVELKIEVGKKSIIGY